MNIKHDDFVNAVIEAVTKDFTDRGGNFNVSGLLTIPGMWEILSEEYINEALDYLNPLEEEEE